MCHSPRQASKAPAVQEAGPPSLCSISSCLCSSKYTSVASHCHCVPTCTVLAHILHTQSKHMQLSHTRQCCLQPRVCRLHATYTVRSYSVPHNLSHAAILSRMCGAVRCSLSEQCSAQHSVHTTHNGVTLQWVRHPLQLAFCSSNCRSGSDTHCSLLSISATAAVGQTPTAACFP